MDSRNRRLQRALRADASLEARVAFVAEGIRNGRIDLNLVERASMVGNETAMAVVPDAAGLLTQEHSRINAISDYLVYDRPDLLNIVLLWASRIIRDGIREFKLKLGNKSVVAQTLWFTLRDMYPVRVEDYEDIENRLSVLVDNIHEEHRAEGFYARPTHEKARVIRMHDILAATLHTWKVAGFYWDFSKRTYELRSLFQRISSILQGLSAIRYPAKSNRDAISSVCDALMGLPYGL